MVSVGRDIGRFEAYRVHLKNPLETAGFLLGLSGALSVVGALRGQDDLLAGEAMTPGPSTIRPSARLEPIVQRMRDQDLSSLPITTSDGRLVGLLLRADAEEHIGSPS